MKPRGYIRKRGGSYAITVSAGVDPATGKRSQKYSSASTPEAADVELTRMLRDLDTNMFADPTRLKLVDYLRDSWLPHIATRVRPRTLLRYRQLLERHVVPKIGAVRLGKIRPLHVQAIVDAMIAGGLAPRTTAGAYRTLHAALKQAVRWQILTVNAAAAVQPPRAERPKLTVPDSAMVGRLLGAARTTRWYVPLVLAATSGMRRGEVLALRWASVNLDTGLVRVVASLQLIDGLARFQEPKTARARRTLALPTATVAVLRRHRKEQTERRLLLGEAWRDLDLVVEEGDGQPVSPDAFSRAFYRMAHGMGLPDVRLHDLRHAYATALLVAGVHPKVASEALGHSSVGFTLDTYSHVVPSMQQAAADAIEAAIGQAVQE
jgi:integrase